MRGRSFPHVGAIAHFVDYAVSLKFKSPIRVVTKVWSLHPLGSIRYPGVEVSTVYHACLPDILPDGPPHGNYPTFENGIDFCSPPDVNPLDVYVPDPFDLLDMDETNWGMEAALPEGPPSGEAAEGTWSGHQHPQGSDCMPRFG